MRSVVVVLPASMCAMIPMLRTLSRLYLRGMERASLVGGRFGLFRPLPSGHEKGPQGPVHDATVGTGRAAMESGSPWLDSAAGSAGTGTPGPANRTNIAGGMGAPAGVGLGVGGVLGRGRARGVVRAVV